MTATRVTIVPGSRWRSRDKRDDGLIVTVLAYEGEHGFVTIQRFRKSRVRTARFRQQYEPLLGGEQ